MFEVDNYLDKRFNLTHYNCWHFVLEVWRDLTGEQLWDYTPDKKSKGELQLAAHNAAHKFVEVNETRDCWQKPLIVLATTPCDSPHVGVLYQSKVLHLRAEGAMNNRLDEFLVCFHDVKFYTTVPRQ